MMNYTVYPERNDDTIRFSALDRFMAKYRDSQVKVLVVEANGARELNVEEALFFGDRLILKVNRDEKTS